MGKIRKNHISVVQKLSGSHQTSMAKKEQLVF
jgi:hypothetical protein